MDRWAKKLVGLAGPGDRILDVGCGTGVVARHAAEIQGLGARIVGLDSSPDMLAVARLASISAGAQIEWVEGDAADMPFEDAQFDVVLCQFAFMFMPDKSAAAREMRRMLSPGGKLGLSVFASGPYDQALSKVLSRHAEPDENDYAIWAWGYQEKLRPLIEQAGFEITRIEQESIPSRYASVRQSIELMRDWSMTVAGLAPHVFEQVCRDMESEMRDHSTDRGFDCPEPVIIITARAR